MKILKVGSLEVGSKPFAPQGEVRRCVFPPDCMLLCWGVEFLMGMYLSLSHPIDVDFFFFHLSM